MGPLRPVGGLERRGAPGVDGRRCRAAFRKKRSKESIGGRHAQALIQVIQVLSWAGKNEEALRLTDRAERTCPGLSEAPSYRGRLLEKMGRKDEAFRCYREAVRRNPEDSLALSRMAYALLDRNQLEAARAFFATAIRYTPDAAPLGFHVEVHMGFGTTFMRLKQWEDARIEFRSVLEAAPENAEARRCLDEVESQLSSASGQRRRGPAQE